MKFSIKDLREVVRTLTYIRNDFSGSTRDEQLRVNLRERYGQHITHLNEILLITPIRFAKDIENAQQALAWTETQISRNEERQRQAKGEPVHPRLANSGEIVVHAPAAIKQISCVIHFDFKNKRILN